MNDLKELQSAAQSEPIEALPAPAMTPRMTKERIAEARRILLKYKGEKQNLDARIVDDEQWWKLRHWEQLNKERKAKPSPNKIEPKSAWLFNCINAKHADFMDSMPTFAILPREASDEGSATILTQIMPVILQQSDFDSVYDANCLTKCKHGTAVYGVFWDASTNLGDIKISKVDVLNLFWKGGITDIQKSPHLFHVQLRDVKELEAAYPQLKNKIGGENNSTVAQYLYDDSVDTTDSVEVVDWYYKQGRALHLCTFVGDEILYATENDEQRAQTGLYAHGEYPFHFDTLFKVEGTPAGFGYIDVLKSDQEQIDTLGKAIINNVTRGAKKKWVFSKSANINKKDFEDPDVELIEAEGAIDLSKYAELGQSALPGITQNILQSKISEMKETSGNNEVTSGGVPSGVTSGAAIAALQEQGGKTSRDAIKASYRCYAKIVKMVIELIRQFYDVKRTFRIIGETGQQQFVQFGNVDMQGQPIMSLEQVIGYAEPIYDVEVSAQKSSPYSQMAQNELALQLYNAGFFAPQNVDNALAAIELMDFKDKSKVTQIISRNGTLYQMNMELTQRVAMLEQMLGLAQNMSAPTGKTSTGAKKAEVPETNEEGTVTNEPETNKKARERTAATTEPR